MMKKIFTILGTIYLLSVSCTKTNDLSGLPVISESRSMNSVSPPLEKKFVANSGDTVILKLVMEPVVACHSYRNGETPKPCDIFIEFTCTLSQPVNSYIMVDIKKKNISGPADPKPGGFENEGGVGFTLAPNITKFTYRSSLRNSNNIAVAENQFSIENVTCYNRID